MVRVTRFIRSASRGGFTFVELLIAALMISIMFLGLTTHLGGGVQVWRRVTETSESLQRQRMALERLQRELTSALLYDRRAESYGEQPGLLPSLAFEEDTLRWIMVGVTQPQQPARVRFVTYACGQHEGQWGLWRTSQSIGEARSRQAPTPQLVLPECETLSLRYAFLPQEESAPLEWQTRWPDPEKALPRLIILSMHLTSGHQLQRLVMIPSGALKPQPVESPS